MYGKVLDTFGHLAIHHFASVARPLKRKNKGVKWMIVISPTGTSLQMLGFNTLERE
jgi:hypothetical protein